MCPLLEFEADRRCFLITINSFNTELTRDMREKLYPSCGKLYPEGLVNLNGCEDFEGVSELLNDHKSYQRHFYR